MVVGGLVGVSVCRCFDVGGCVTRTSEPSHHMQQQSMSEVECGKFSGQLKGSVSFFCV